MVPPNTGGLTPTPEHWLSGCDPTTRIVSVDADRHGHARVWRRTDDGRLEATEHRFPNWFLATSLDLLAHLPARHLPAHVLERKHGRLDWPEGLSVVHLDCPEHVEDAYRYLVLTDDLDEVETTLVETANKADGADAQTLADLRGLVLEWHPIEQFLLLSGRTYFRGMTFEDLRRVQFDLETTGLNDERDRIFMVSLRDSSGWTECLDTGSLSEARLIERFVELIKARDPDVLENHNIFAFDLPFLVRRAARLGVPLALGRDGSEPWLETDVFDGAEPFQRWRVRGREVVDTQHAVRRFGALAPDMRRHGLKDAARYFGFARDDREYVPGAEIWPTYQIDPDRVRRYAADDVAEVDGLSRRLLPITFALAQSLPSAYEHLAADAGPTALWEPLLVRAYLHEARAIEAPSPRLQRPLEPADNALKVRGVVSNAVRATFDRLLPCVITAHSVRAGNDTMAAMSRLLRDALAEPRSAASDALARASFTYLSAQRLLSDPDAATAAQQIAGRFVQRLERDLESHGCEVVEADGEQVLFAAPPNWDALQEESLSRSASSYLPTGVRVEFPGHYRALYARAARSTILLGYDGTVTLIGTSFRPGRLERFGEDFVRHAAPLALLGDAVGLRRLFTETVHLIRTGQIPLDDLCAQATLHKSPPQYRRGGTQEEPYEVLLAAGVRSWRLGHRVRYYRTRGGEPRLLQEGDEASPAEADAEYYVQRLVAMYAQQFIHAFSRPDYLRIFGVPSGSGPFDEPALEAALAAVKPVAERVEAVAGITV